MGHNIELMSIIGKNAKESAGGAMSVFPWLVYIYFIKVLKGL